LKCFCKNCKELGIPVLDTLAYSTGGGSLICKKCGTSFRMGKLIRFTYLTFEGLLLFFSVLYALGGLVIWPLVLAIVVVIVFRGLLLPLFYQDLKGHSNFNSLD